MTRRVAENEWLILKTNQGLSVLVQASSNPDANSIKIGKCKLEPKWLLEHANVGFTYEIHSNDAHVCEESLEDSEMHSHAGDNASNQYLLDNNTAQKLTADELSKMKYAGASGRDLVNALMQNSETFQDKTSFAKEKYILKKFKKHCQQFTVYPSSLPELTELKYLRGLCNATPSYRGLRFDYLYHMIQFVEPKSEVLVLDQSGGILLGGVIQSLAGEGSLYQLVRRKMKDVCSTRFNVPSNYFTVIKKVELNELLNDLRHMRPYNICEEKNLPVEDLSVESSNLSDIFNENKSNKDDISHIKRSKKIETKDGETEADEEDTIIKTSSPRSFLKREDLTEMERKRNLKKLQTEKVDLIVAAIQIDDYQCIQYIMLLVECIKRYLIPNGRFCIFSANFAHMRIISTELSKYSYALQIEELFLREYQVAPNKTHPLMGPSQRVFSGFLATGFRLFDDQGPK